MQKGRKLRRLLIEAAFLRAALDECLESASGAAFVVDADGAPLRMNAAARLRYEKAPDATRSELREVMLIGTGPGVSTVRELRTNDDRARYLIIVDTEATARGLDLLKRLCLTRREREVALLLLTGASNSRIGAELCISDRTVECHVEAILRKANVSSRAAFVAVAGGFLS